MDLVYVLDDVLETELGREEVRGRRREERREERGRRTFAATLVIKLWKSKVVPK